MKKMVKKCSTLCSTNQRFIRKRNTTYRIHNPRDLCLMTGHTTLEPIVTNFYIFFQNVSALDLAALNDKATIAVFLARTLESQGFDPNAPNDQGHTVLHLLARKGDECAATLEALLSMVQENKNSKRLFRIDVVNHGHKTPLDVAVICAEMYSTGKDRAIYTETIKLFQDVIIDEANSFMD